MSVIVAGHVDFDPAVVEEVIRAAAPLIAGAKTERGCIAYEWTADILVPGRVRVFEEWVTEDDLVQHLADAWYRDMLALLGRFTILGSVTKKYRVDLSEPVYDAAGVPQGRFWSAAASSEPVPDRLAIRELCDRYIDAVYRRHSADWAAGWAEDCSWTLLGVTYHGRAAVLAAWEAAMAGFEFAHMYMTGNTVRIAGDSASGRCYMLERLKPVGGPETMISGRYDDRYVRGADGVWRFQSRHYEILPAPPLS